MDTTNILFICGGAFVGLDKVSENRVSNRSLGFNADIKTQEERKKMKIIFYKESSPVICQNMV